MLIVQLVLKSDAITLTLGMLRHTAGCAPIPVARPIQMRSN